MTRMALALTVIISTAVIILPASEGAAGEGRVGSSEYSGKTIWTNRSDLTEIARFPRGSKDPSFIVYLEYLDPFSSDCSREDEQAGDCERPDLCHIWVKVHPDLQPVRSEPIQDDPSRVLIAWYDEDSREGNGTHMHPHWDFGVLVEGRNGEVLWFHAPIIIRYGAGAQQCMAGVKIEYTNNTKNLFNHWRGPR